MYPTGALPYATGINVGWRASVSGVPVQVAQVIDVSNHLSDYNATGKTRGASLLIRELMGLDFLTSIKFDKVNASDRLNDYKQVGFC